MKTLYINLEDYVNHRLTIVKTLVPFTIGLSFMGLSYLLFPAIVAGEITFLMITGYVGLISLAWFLALKFLGGYISQFVFATKGETHVSETA